jgi:hypothetical protein
MREFLKILPLGLALPLVIGAASVKPDDAISTIGAWAHTFGFESLSRWLANPASDNRVIAASVALSVLYSFVMFTLPVLREHRENPNSGRLKVHFLTMGFYFFCAVVVISIWRFVPGPQTLPIAPPPPPVAAPKLSAEPWVSSEEFQAAKTTGKFLIPFSPEEIANANYSQGAVATDAYVGRWVKINHPFVSVRQEGQEKILNSDRHSIWMAELPNL